MNKKIKLPNPYPQKIYTLIDESRKKENQNLYTYDKDLGATFQTKEINSHLIHYKDEENNIIWTMSSSSEIKYEIIEE
jgi:hypothetical protein